MYDAAGFADPALTQRNLLRILRARRFEMPVPIRTRVSALVEDVGSRAKVAELLEVDRSRVTRWLDAGQEPDEANRRAIDAIEFALERLTSRYQLETALKWLAGSNPHLRGSRPIELLRDGRVAEVITAIEADETGSYA